MTSLTTEAVFDLDVEQDRERITIAFYTLLLKEVPANIPSTTYFEENGIKLLDDKYSETGHFTLIIIIIIIIIIIKSLLMIRRNRLRPDPMI